MTELPTPRVLFAEGMNLHQQQLQIDPRPIGDLMIRAGATPAEAYDFDIVFHPGGSRIALGSYTKDTAGQEITTTDGHHLQLQKRALNYYISPNAKPSRIGLKFALLHEAGHMHADFAGTAPEIIAYHDKQVQQRVRRIGYAGWGLVGAAIGAYVATQDIQSSPARTLLDVGLSATTAVGMAASVGATMPLEARWLVDKEEWKAHGFALRHWGTDILPTA